MSHDKTRIFALHDYHDNIDKLHNAAGLILSLRGWLTFAVGGGTLDTDAVRTLLRQFGDGYARRDPAHLDEFMDLFVPDEELEVI